MKGPREKLLYVPCIYTGSGKNKPDYLATVDCNPQSKDYGKVQHIYTITIIIIDNTSFTNELY